VGGREFHSLTVEGEKENLNESILDCNWVKYFLLESR